MKKKTFVVHFVGGETLTIPDVDGSTFDNIAIGRLIKVGNRRILTSNITFIEEYEQNDSKSDFFTGSDDGDASPSFW